MEPLIFFATSCPCLLRWTAPKVVRCLLDAGADPNVRSNYQATPLWWSARRGHTAIATLLIASGADPKLADFDGSAPLHAAADNKHFNVAEVLINAGADIDAMDDDGRTPATIDETGRVLELGRRKRSDDAKGLFDSMFDDLTEAEQAANPPRRRRGIVL